MNDIVKGLMAAANTDWRAFKTAFPIAGGSFIAAGIAMAVTTITGVFPVAFAHEALSIGAGIVLVVAGGIVNTWIYSVKERARVEQLQVAAALLDGTKPTREPGE